MFFGCWGIRPKPSLGAGMTCARYAGALLCFVCLPLPFLPVAHSIGPTLFPVSPLRVLTSHWPNYSEPLQAIGWQSGRSSNQRVCTLPRSVRCPSISPPPCQRHHRWNWPLDKSFGRGLLRCRGEPRDAYVEISLLSAVCSLQLWCLVRYCLACQPNFQFSSLPHRLLPLFQMSETFTR